MSDNLRYMKFEMTPENTAARTMPMEITLPNFLWLTLAQIAKDMERPLEQIFQRIFETGLEKGPLVAALMIREDEIPPAMAPGGRA